MNYLNIPIPNDVMTIIDNKSSEEAVITNGDFSTVNPQWKSFFIRGATFVFLNPQLMQELFIKAMKWADTKAVRTGYDTWTMGSGKETKYFASDELFTEFLKSIKC